MDINKLKGHVPDSVLAQIPMVVTKFGMDTSLELAHFLAQCAHESGNFKAVTENLNYSADGLKKIFPKYFPGNLNESYARKPEAIASRVYGGRMGNGPEATKDGFKFRGRGYIQLTGRANYKFYGDLTGFNLIANPELLVTDRTISAIVSVKFILVGLHGNVKFKDQESANRAVTQVIGGKGLNLDKGYGAELLAKVNDFSNDFVV